MTTGLRRFEVFFHNLFGGNFEALRVIDWADRVPSPLCYLSFVQMDELHNAIIYAKTIRAG